MGKRTLDADARAARRKAVARKSALKWYRKNKARALAANKKWCAENRAQRRKTRRAWIAAHPGCTLVWAAKHRARKDKLPFDLEYEKLLFPTHCPALGMPLRYDGAVDKTGVNRLVSASLDRINPNKGYTLDNVRVMSYLANVMKQNATPEQLRKFARWVLATFPEET